MRQAFAVSQCDGVRVYVCGGLAATPRPGAQRSSPHPLPISPTDGIAHAPRQVLDSMAAPPAAGAPPLPAAGRKRRAVPGASELLSRVRRREVGPETLARLLTEHVDRIDTDMVRLLAFACCLHACACPVM